MNPILEVKHIHKQYANHIALNDVSLVVEPQKIFGLLGPNGAGKTSLIRIINQITGPDQGEVFFNGEKLAPKHVDMIGYLPEERGLYKKMSVGEQVMYLAQLKGLKKNDAKTKLKEWFRKFEIESWWDKKIEELSKGMQQKVQFIVTVLHEPKLLILDEPFSGFDPINAQLIKKEILELREKGATIIFSTHNMGSVEELCDNIALINKSQKLLDGSVKEIRKTYRSSMYNIVFKGNLLGFTNAVWAGAEFLEKKSEDDVHTVTLKLLRQNKPNDLLQAVLNSGEILSFHEVIPSMNDIFISVVEQKQAANTQSSFTE
ncbi:MAG: ATP-binding cassette domain-containing protein [Bacteroidia bacterium]|jgi:ABC-2 type transport system ATP-binding protein|nr:ATP-binding cassette domain-containing protein [Bacteroidia bacterium]